MNRDKIEEMAKDIPSRIVAYNSDPKGRHLYIEQRKCIAEALYNAGYRKELDVAREICCKIEEEIVKALESNYNAKVERMRKPCIDMADEFIGWVEGKISALRGIEDFVAELKKKCESEGEE